MVFGARGVLLTRFWWWITARRRTPQRWFPVSRRDTFQKRGAATGTPVIADWRKPAVTLFISWTTIAFRNPIGPTCFGTFSIRVTPTWRAALALLASRVLRHAWNISPRTGQSCLRIWLPGPRATCRRQI